MTRDTFGGGILFLLVIASIIGTYLAYVGGMSDKQNEEKYTMTKCFDDNHNEIIGASCKKRGESSYLPLLGLILTTFVPTVVLMSQDEKRLSL